MVAAQVTANLHAATSDPARVVEYRPGGSMLGILPVVLILIAVALAMLVFDDGGRAFLPAVLLLVLMPGILLMDLWKHRPSAPPGLVLTPWGLGLATGGWGLLEVPWSAIGAIDTRSFEGFGLRVRGRNRTRFKDVTMIRLPEGFLAAERAAGRFVPKGPSVDWVVRPGPDGDWIALHHEVYSLTPAEVRAPVEARWSAYREAPPPEPTPEPTPEPAPGPALRMGGFRPRNPALFRVGTAVGAVAVLVVLANMAGLWQTEAQTRARAWAERMEATRERDRALTREAEERHRRMFDRMSQPGFPFNR